MQNATVLEANYAMLEKVEGGLIRNLKMVVRASGNSLQYVVILFLLDGWPFAFIVVARGNGRRGGITRLLRLWTKSRHREYL